MIARAANYSTSAAVPAGLANQASQANPANQVLADLAALAAAESSQAGTRCLLTSEDYWQIVDQFSHDIRTPLCVISEYASLIRDGILADDPDERNQAMDITRARVAEIQLQTDALLTIAKLGSGRLAVKRETASIAEILHDASERVIASSKSSGVIFAPIVDPQLPPLECDARLTRCVLVNLLWSILKAAPTQACIRLEARHGAGEREICFRVSSSEMRRYEVAPTGLASQVKMLSEKQKTRRQHIDVALGLAYEVAHILGGKITFNDDSIEPPALEFTLPVPCAADCE